MPYTVPYSFSILQSEYVDLPSEQTKIARASREYLKSQIKKVATQVDNFPKLQGGFQDFGSFARKTKVRPLDDIDTLLLISAGKDSYIEYLGLNTYTIIVPDRTCPTWIFTNDDDRTLNSRKVLTKIRNSLTSVENYKQAEIKYTGEAVVLKLKSYDWSFDIVPAVPVTDGQGGTKFYMIPDGDGDWKRTDPRRDQRAITAANQKHDEYLIPLIRLLKYWNTRYYNVPRISSYYLETMLIRGFDYYPTMTDTHENILTAFSILSASVLNSCPDPKGLEADLDTSTSWDTRQKVQLAAKAMAAHAVYAIVQEESDNHKGAIETWGKVFPDFPAYGQL